MTDRLMKARAGALQWGSRNGGRWFLASLAIFVVLTSFFSSNIQTSFPTFSRAMRLGLTLVAGAMLVIKTYLLTPLTGREFFRVTAVLALTLLLSVTSGDIWFFATALLVAAARNVDLEKALRLFLFLAAGCILLVQLLHLAGLIPYTRARTFDYGYGHYNGFAGRLLGLYIAAMVLYFRRMKPWHWVLAGCVPVAIHLITTSRGGTAAATALYVVLLAYRLLPGVFHSRAMRVLIPLYGVFLWGFSLYGMVAFDDTSRFWQIVDKLDSLRFSFGHNKWVEHGFSLLGGVAVDTGPASAVDNVYMAVTLNKGILGAVFMAAAFLALLWLLCKKGRMLCALAFCAVLLHGMVENHIVEISSDPMILWMVFLLYPDGQDALPDLALRQK